VATELSKRKFESAPSLKALYVEAVIKILMHPIHLHNRYTAKLQYVLPFALLSGLGWQAQALAHGVMIDYATTQAIEITALYDTGEPMANAQVVVYAPNDPSTPWMTGSTTESGSFTFSPDPTQSGNWEVAVRQAGHGEILSIPFEPEASATQPQDSSQPSAARSTGESSTGESSTGENGLTADAPNTRTESAQVGQARTSAGLSPMQRALMAGSAIWGFVGTALFFMRGKK
jgi:nickel transport protein